MLKLYKPYRHLAVAVALAAGPAWAIPLIVNGEVVADVSVDNISLAGDAISISLTDSTLSLARADSISNPPPADPPPPVDPPPVDPPPVDPPPVDPPPGSTEGCDSDLVDCASNLGVIVQTAPGTNIQYFRATVLASSFIVGTGAPPDTVRFNFAPQGAVVEPIRVWVSSVAGGAPLNGRDRCDSGDRAGRTISLDIVMEGSSRDDAISCTVVPGQPYFLNQQATGTLSAQIVARAIAGAF